MNRTTGIGSTDMEHEHQWFHVYRD